MTEKCCEYTRYCQRDVAGQRGVRSWGNMLRLFKARGPATFQKEKLRSVPATDFCSVKSAPPLSLIPGSARYYWSMANSKLANRQGSELIIQLTVEKLKFFIKGKWNTVNLCFNGAFPPRGIYSTGSLTLLWSCNSAKKWQKLYWFKNKAGFELFFPPCMMIFPATITVTHSL